MKEWREIFGTEEEKPEEFDKKSSPTTIYQRRNILKENRIEQNGIVVSGWKREERELTLEEYSILILISEIKQDILNIQKEQIIDEYTLQLIEEGVI